MLFHINSFRQAVYRIPLIEGTGIVSGDVDTTLYNANIWFYSMAASCALGLMLLSPCILRPYEYRHEEKVTGSGVPVERGGDGRMVAMRT